MNPFTSRSLCQFSQLLLLTVWLSLPVAAHQSAPQLGSVNFPISCTAEAVKQAGRGLALLHHMTYEDSRAAFAAATATDPDCAMGYWGQGMTYIHPLWSDPPTEEEYLEAVVLLNKAKNIGKKKLWEAAYIDALESYFTGPWSKDEAPRLSRYAKVWENIYRQYPDDTEAAALYALAHLSTADPKDKSYTKQITSGNLATQVLGKLSDHPGGHHYSIHAYDYPSLANRALAVAQSYGKIAPQIPHALHMPTHIFTREGMWQDSIEWNIKSAAAALKKPVNGAFSLHYLHALDYLAYAYLQKSQDSKAREVLATLKALNGPIQPHVASAYTLAAVPARLALERQQWSAAAKLEPRMHSGYPWKKYPAMEAISYFARALGAAHIGNRKQAQADIARLAALKNQLPPSASYWATQIEIQRLSALAWLQYQENKQQALATMKAAASLEASTEKHPVTPGEVLPAHELLADMLLELSDHQSALAKYQAALKRSPNRLNSLYGAGLAAERLGKSDQAKNYYQQLVELTAGSDSEQPRLQHARDYLLKAGT